MLTIFLHTLRESVSSRTGLILLLVSLLAVGTFIWFHRIETVPDGTVLLHGPGRRPPVPASVAVPQAFEALLPLTGGLWLILGMFAAGPLLTSHLERGWAELLYAKGVRRSEVLLGRYLGALGVFVLALVVFDAVPALYLWARTGMEPWRFFAGVAVLLFSFTTVLALMTIVAVGHPNPALPILLGFLQVFLSAVLARRTSSGMYDLVTAKWAQWLIDWVYRILPKNYELQHLAVDYLRTGKIDSWWPVWSSALFLAGALVAAWLLLRRKEL